MKKLLSAILVLSVLLCSCSYNPGADSSDGSVPESEKGSSLSSLSLPYFSEDSLNPLTVKSTVNISLIPLMYDSLIKVENNFSESLCLASSVIKNDRIYTVTLRDDALFSDGSPLTASDVVWSINTAKAYSPYYKDKLSTISSAYANKDGQVIITLVSDDIYGILNFDFPICKKVNNIKNTIGTGRYVFKDGALFKNEHHFEKIDYTFNPLKLVSLPDNDSLFLSLKTNTVNIIPSDLSLGTFSGLSGNTKKVNTSNMIYLGLSTSGALGNVNVRRLISASIDRELLSSRAISSASVPTALPIHPIKPQVLNLNKTYKDQSAIDELMKDESIEKKEDGIYFAGKKLSITILIPSDNAFKKSVAQVLKAQLEEIGIAVSIKEEVFETYKAYIATGNFDVYVGEVKLSNSMNLSTFLSSGEFSIYPTAEFIECYNAFLSSVDGEAKFSEDFYSKLPFLPLLFKNSAVAYSRSISVDVKTSITDTYSNINDLK